MAYRTERDLQLEIMDLNEFCIHSGYLTFFRREVPIGECIPDIVCVQFLNIPIIQSWPRSWSGKHSFIVWLIRQRGCLLPETIAKLCYEPLGRIYTILEELVACEILIERKAGLLALSPDMASIRAEVVAVETKLYRWREALLQALRYSQFANKVIVAMDASRMPRKPEVIAEFRRHEIGLCGVNSGEIEWLVHAPSSRQTSSHEREYLITSTISPKSQSLWFKR